MSIKNLLPGKIGLGFAHGGVGLVFRNGTEHVAEWCAA